MSEPASVPPGTPFPGEDVLRGGKGHCSLLPDLPVGDDQAAGPDGGTYATAASPAPAAPQAAPATGYAGGRGLLDRAQPVVADLCRRDAELQPEEGELSEGWSELSSV